jgi:3-methyladenine DNA glycosylase Tag
MWIMCLQYETIRHRETIISLQTDNATQAQRVSELEERFDNYPFDHSKFETDINLIGGAVFENWDMASERYSKRGKR